MDKALEEEEAEKAAAEATEAAGGAVDAEIVGESGTLALLIVVEVVAVAVL